MLNEAFDGLLSGENPSPIVHNKLWDLLKQYYVVGGMPRAVQAFIDQGENATQGFSEARTVQSELLDTYVRDFNKHAGKVNAVHISSVFENIPRQLSSHIDGSVKRYRFGGIIPGKRRFAELQGPIDWLVKSGLAFKVHICPKAELPLKAFTKQNIFKMFVFDVGLLGCMLELTPGTMVLQDYGQTKGFFAENFVACELFAAGETNLYSWSGRNSEIEFLKDCGGEIVPIEVKSGIRTKAKSLRVYMERYEPRVAIKITANPLCIGEGALKNVPLYCAGRLPKYLPALLSP
jgi:predicted AAA+ superfamily ATPase